MSLMIYKIHLKTLYKRVIMIIQRKHPLQSGCSKFIAILSLRTPPILCSRQDRHFYFRFFFLLLRKASNAITRLPKAHNNVSMPMKIEMISKAVIHATSLPMYSGKPGIWCWEATTLSWVLSVKILYHVSN